jgi:cell division transport system permease protein
MSKSNEKFNKRRLRSSYISVVVSIALVLYMLGVLGVLVLNAQKVSNHVKENFTMILLLKQEAPEIEVRQLQKSLGLEEFVKEAEYVSKEEAAEIMKTDLGEDFISFLGYNPLSNSIEVRFNADFVESETIAEVASQYAQNELVAEVSYDRDLIQIMNDNIERISIGILALSALLLIISIALINSSIRLSIYSKRFIIKTMQLVGATRRFIRRPFLWRGVQMGVLGALIAYGLLAATLMATQRNLPELEVFSDIQMLGIIAGALLVLGLVITWISSFFAVKRYLNLKTDELYF